MFARGSFRLAGEPSGAKFVYGGQLLPELRFKRLATVSHVSCIFGELFQAVKLLRCLFSDGASLVI